MKKEATSTWELLKHNLFEQVALYYELLLTLKEENKILINNQASRLSTIVATKDIINEKIIKLQDLYNSFYSQIIINHKGLNKLSKLIDYAPEEFKEQLIQCEKDLSEIAAQIRKFNFINKQLIESSMKYIASMMMKLAEIKNEEQVVYCYRGYKKCLGEEQNFMSIVA